MIFLRTAFNMTHLKFRLQGLLGVHSRYGLHTRAVTVYRDTLIEGFSHFVTSMTAPIASGWSVCRVGFAPTYMRASRVKMFFRDQHFLLFVSFKGSSREHSSALMAWRTLCLGRAERSIPRARRVAPEGARG